MTVNEFLEETKEICYTETGTNGRAHLRVRPRIVCEDGFSISIQASAYHECTPQDSEGPYEEVEVGHPSKPVVELLGKSMDGGPSEPTQATYPNIPVDLVNQILEEHGGIDREATGLEVESNQ